MNIDQEIREIFTDDLWDDPEQFVIELKSFVKKYVSKAVEETKGYRTDTEYISGKTLEEFIIENEL